MSICFAFSTSKANLATSPRSPITWASSTAYLDGGRRTLALHARTHLLLDPTISAISLVLYSSVNK
ncbi:MAG: hypothetical protein DMG59_29295 [Acidobacteria bacterium]|nr:MAG: hypothetical protein DMG59_29295 [Acidobacteriota bacterium]